MIRVPKFFGLHAEPTRLVRIIAGLIPFILIIAVYLWASNARLAENPSDKLMPSITKIAEAVDQYAFTNDSKTGRPLLVDDTLSSLKRIVTGLGLAVICGSWIGMNMGLFSGMSATMLPIIKFLSTIPPLAILPVLFITFGVGEVGKIVLIFVGSYFLIVRGVYNATKEIPYEQVVKALTLGASQLEIIYRIILPQIMPKIIILTRHCLGGAWLFLIASEAIASTDGLGYRIFLVRRYMSMDVIIPYVLWITFLGFLMDTVLRRYVKRRYRWYLESD
jgi:NitT/TauT family transport system permease protein